MTIEPASLGKRGIRGLHSWTQPDQTDMKSKTLTAASVRPIMLSVLAEGESYGYAIMQRIHVLSNGDIQWSDGTLYPVLHRLELEKLIASRWGMSETGRKRKYYSLTSLGEKSLAFERAEWMKVHSLLATLWNVPSPVAG